MGPRSLLAEPRRSSVSNGGFCLLKIARLSLCPTALAPLDPALVRGKNRNHLIDRAGRASKTHGNMNKDKGRMEHAHRAAYAQETQCGVERKRRGALRTLRVRESRNNESDPRRRLAWPTPTRSEPKPEEEIRNSPIRIPCWASKNLTPVRRVRSSSFNSRSIRSCTVSSSSSSPSSSASSSSASSSSSLPVGNEPDAREEG